MSENHSMTPQEKYDKENTQFVGMKLSKKNDADILEAINGKAKQTELKRLIRLGLGESAESSVGMTDYQFKFILSLIKVCVETMDKSEVIDLLDSFINEAK
ncbi:MAG: hypothetical protein LUI06_04555 [Ruminococcus sp.]|nr:hypothetical protein [Ruminococcus sp.]